MLKPSAGMLCAMLVALALVAQPLGQPSHATASTLVGPKAYYLALGDSVTYGEQPNGDVSHGFADDLFRQYLKPRGTTTLVNMACVHETTTTFLHGGCPNASSVKTSY